MTIATGQNAAVVGDLERYYLEHYPVDSKLQPKDSPLLLGRLVFTSLLICRVGLDSELPKGTILVRDKTFKAARRNYLETLQMDTEEVLEPVFADLLRVKGPAGVIDESIIAIPRLLKHETRTRNLILTRADPLWAERRKTRRQSPSRPTWLTVIRSARNRGFSGNPERIVKIAGEYIRVSTSHQLVAEEARLGAPRDYKKEG